MLNSTCRQKASVQDAFFYVRTILLALAVGSYVPHTVASETSCRSDRYDESVRIAEIHDGDTLWLTDGRKLRIIGVNTPELARDETPAEPYAIQARDALRGLLGAEARVKLRLGRETTDRYGRVLAHVFLPEGKNVSQWLLEQGLAMALTVPPNLWGWQCYAEAEQKARSSRRGLWSHQRFQATAANQLEKHTRGYRLVRGTVQRVGFSRSSVWLNLSRGFAIRIKRSDLAYFNGVDLKALQGKKLVARGWVQYHNEQLRMRVRHPSALKIEGQ